MIDKNLMASIKEEAQKVVLNSVNYQSCENIVIKEVSNQVFYKENVPGISIPPVDNSSMDGYAIIANDTNGASINKFNTFPISKDKRSIAKISELYSKVRINYPENTNNPKDYHVNQTHAWRRKLPLEEARELLLQKVITTPCERLSLNEALGRTMLEDLSIQENVPSFDRSKVDGYALLSRDTENISENVPVSLMVLGKVAPGRNHYFQVSSQTTVKVMTGAPLPAGADAVVKCEDVFREGQYIKVYHQVMKGANIDKAGQGITAGETAISKGTLITPPLLGLLAEAGLNDIPVYSALKVAIICTGSELTELGQTLDTGRIYNSNQYLLSALLRKIGVEPVPMGIVPDDAAKIATIMQTALEKTDLVVTTGGASAGDFDLVEPAMAMAGIEGLFSGIDIRPGKSFVAGKKGGKLILGLSGHPGAAFTAFELIVKPVIKKMLGYKDILPRQVEVVLSGDYKKADARRIKTAKLSIEEGIAKASILTEHSILRTLADCNLLVDIPPGSGMIADGEIVTAYIVDLFNMN
ncbi:Molybdopterin molybdenumtransferase [Sporotomaculum syntrophicum]|uniref:Molybdopterin molybdenumtransferase n=1 Tax=Sporotomaculum syntrophicum TaxID=182264 RepID=A0A9D3AXM4_9FIRM|nr:gephyrin-like molybdotransferase Glp [Sporotomaculum syntrophicum]KAF1083803.1 Molybdopterin molybdenumtransferase [Sporotomaculum syntrophicum]